MNAADPAGPPPATPPATPPAEKLQVFEREQAVLRLLRSLPDPDAGATVPQIHRFVTRSGILLPGRDEPVRDSVSMPVYYKLMRRLAAEGTVEERQPADPTSGGTTYSLSRSLHVDTAVNLDDLRDLVEALRPTEAIAQLVDAREYVKSRRDTVLRRAAEALLDVDPRLLVESMILSRVERYNADLDLAVELGAESADPDRGHLQRIERQRVDLSSYCYRIGLTRAAVEVPGPLGPGQAHHARNSRVVVDPGRLAAELEERVVGDTAIRLVSPENASAPADWSTARVSGSDGSTYSSVMQVDTASAFQDAGGAEVVTFNNSVVYVHEEPGSGRRAGMYSVPLTRSAIDSPDNAGMVMAPFMFRHEGMTDGAYEHMAKCATDVVQWRADERVFTGHGRAMGSGAEIPSPRVHFRDGTVTLQERESNHYQRSDSYGAMVREGVRLSYDVLRHLQSRKNPPVFAGAVKASQLRLFADVLNWFIKHGLPSQGVAPIEPAWDVSRGAMLPDNEAMSYLLASLNDRRGEGYFVSYAIVRPFHALTDLYRADRDGDPEQWVTYFERRREQQLREPGADSHWLTIADVEDDPYVRMLQEADYVLFYVGHTSGDPAPLAPRYEFLESLRPLGAEQARARVLRNVDLIVAALDHVRFTTDRDHNFLSRKILVKVIPSVIYTAHENCKALGRMLERELKSTVLANLRRLRLTRATTLEGVLMQPEPVESFVRRWTDAQSDTSDTPSEAGAVGSAVDAGSLGSGATRGATGVRAGEPRVGDS